jgi:hypothetical protein
MTTEAEENTPAWQPLTPRGVAAFARAPLGRLLLVQFVFAAMAGVVAIWFLRTNCYPVVSEAIRQLPARGEIVSGGLNWTNDSPRLLAAGRFISIAADLDHAGAMRSPAQIQVEFGRESVWILSLFGYIKCDYPRGWIIEFNQPELEPKWGAWRAPILWLTMGAVTGGMMAAWALLATVYCLPAWLAGLLLNRDQSLWAGWKIAGVSLMPGALLMIVAIGLFGIGAFDLVKLLAVAGAHFVVGWIYLVAALYYAPKPSRRADAKSNPFAPAAEKKSADQPPAGSGHK